MDSRSITPRLPTLRTILPQIGAPGQPVSQQMAPEEEESMLRRLASRTMSGLAAAGNLLDLPGSMARDVLAGKNPLDQLLTPMTSENRTTGRDLLRSYDIIGPENTAANWFGGLATEILTDPTTFLAPLALTKAGKAAQMTGRLAGTLPAQIEAGQRATLGLRVPFTNIGTDLVGRSAIGEGIAKGLSSAGQAVRYSAPVRNLAGMLYKPVEGTLSREGQQFAEPLFAAKELDESKIRSAVAWMGQRIQEEGLDQGKYSTEVLTRALEGLPRASDPDVPVDILNKLWDINASNIDEATDLGRDVGDLLNREKVIQRYMSRRQVFKAPGSGKGQLQASGMAPSDIARESAYVNIPGGTDTARRIISDPDINAVIDAADIATPEARKGLTEVVARMIRDRLPGGVTYAMPAEKVEELAGSIISLPSEVRRAGLWGNHPLVDFLHGATFAKQANTMTRSLYDFLGENGADLFVGHGEGTRLTDILKSWGLKAERAAVHIGQRFGKALKEEDLAEMWVRADVASDLTKFWDRFTSPRSVSEFLKTVDNAQNLWRFVQTSSNPAFHTRNWFSGQVANFLANMWSKPSYTMRAQIDEGKIAVGASKIPFLARELERRGSLVTDENATKLIQEFSYAHNITPRYQSAGQLMEGGTTPAQKVGTLDDIFGEIPGGEPARWTQIGNAIAGQEPGTVPVWKPGTIRGFRGAEKSTWGWAAAGDIAAHKIETAARLSPFIELMRQVPDSVASKMTKEHVAAFLQHAADKVGAVQVRYQNKYFTPLERDVLTRMFPFYRFSSRQIPYLMKHMADPGSRLAWAIRAESRARDPEAVLPPYVSETTAIPLGESEPGHWRYLTGFGLMHEDPLQFGIPIPGIGTGVRKTLMETASRMEPISKSAIEWLSGQSMFQTTPAGGRQLEELDPTLARIGANINEAITGRKQTKLQPWPSQGVEFLAANIVGRPLFTLRAMTDPRKMTAGALPLAANLLTGFRVADVSPTSRESAAADAISAELRDMGARNFVRPYVPAAFKERMTQDELAKVNEALLFQRALDRRMKERGKKKKAATSA